MIRLKRIYAIEAWCVNCHRCEVACKTFHSKSKNAYKAFMLEYPAPQRRVHVEGDTGISIAVNCRHCKHPKCVEGCISGAMTKNPLTGLVTSNPEKCVGCRTCMSMCPFGAVRIEPGPIKDIAFKCDLCTLDGINPGQPSCVATCPNNALVYIDSEEVDDAKSC